MAHGVKLDTLSMEDLQALITDAQKALSVKVEAERSELLKKLSALDAISKPAKAPERQRNSPKPKYRTPAGDEWSGRGGIPKVFKELGVQTKEDMAKYLIKD
ncbi:H-NS histone family protein [Agrobacterium pusense]|uniref:H-NS histone family protein n=1 Tax=Agrobacterium pusense TaxID=648995 RepID=UPI00142EC4ED|nr:H-NS histone family protein [Agrobacterium pusense]